jgi:hypothetical protein
MHTKFALNTGSRSRESSLARSHKHLKIETEAEASSGRPLDLTFKRKDMPKSSLKSSSQSKLHKTNFGLVKCVDLSQESIKPLVPQNEPEIISSQFYAP